MKSILCAVFDRKAKSYGPPMVFVNEDIARRMAVSLLQASGGQSDLEKYPDDFDLYYIADYDNEFGIVAGIETPQFLFTFGNLRQMTGAERRFDQAAE